MTDAEFKKLNHSCPSFKFFNNGKKIEDYYSPDYVLNNGNKFILIEHENQPNRKTIVANIFKAGYFFQGNHSGILVIVLIPKGKSSFESYYWQCKKYFSWLKGKVNLEKVCFIRETDYIKNKAPIEINSREFLDKCLILD